MLTVLGVVALLWIVGAIVGFTVHGLFWVAIICLAFLAVTGLAGVITYRRR